MTLSEKTPAVIKYPAALRALHWLRAFLIIGLIATGWYMADLWDTSPKTAEFLYPNHKQFGLLVWLVAVAHLCLRFYYRRGLPHTPITLKVWEKTLSRIIHLALIALTLLLPMLGYAMSSSFTQSDGVPFFFLAQIPELLPKNDVAFAVFQALHKYGAYLLLACIVLHVAGTLKHRLHDKNGETDVIRRMI